jgi:hypothetical protein
MKNLWHCRSFSFFSRIRYFRDSTLQRVQNQTQSDCEAGPDKVVQPEGGTAWVARKLFERCRTLIETHSTAKLNGPKTIFLAKVESTLADE